MGQNSERKKFFNFVLNFRIVTLFWLCLLETQVNCLLKPWVLFRFSSVCCSDLEMGQNLFLPLWYRSVPIISLNYWEMFNFKLMEQFYKWNLRATLRTFFTLVLLFEFSFFFPIKPIPCYLTLLKWPWPPFPPCNFDALVELFLKSP